MKGRALGLGVLMLLAGCAAPAGDAIEDEPVAAIPGIDVERLAWSAIAEGPTPRTEVVVGLLGGRIYVIGGFPLPPVPVALPVTTVEILDIASGTWSSGPEYPLQVHHAQAVTLGDALCVVGGLVGPAFQPTPLSFCIGEGDLAWELMPAMPAPRGSHAAAVLDDILYVAGGNGPDGHVAEVWAFDPAAASWSVVGDPMPTPRDHTSGGALGGGFCVAGGDVAGHGENTDATECFDPASGAWTTHAPVPTLRGSVAAAVWHERLVVLGGQNATQTFATVEAFDLANDTWVALPPLGVARHGFGVVTHEGALYAAYGGPQPGLTVTSSVERLRDD